MVKIESSYLGISNVLPISHKLLYTCFSIWNLHSEEEDRNGTKIQNGYPRSHSYNLHDLHRIKV